MKLILSLVALTLGLFTTVRSAPHVEPRANTKYVFAHHIVGNTFPYTQATWTTDINLAKSAGIDGFALNVGSEDWEPARVADAYVNDSFVHTTTSNFELGMRQQKQQGQDLSCSFLST